MEKTNAIRDFVNKKQYPFYLMGILFGISAISMLLITAVKGNPKFVWSVFGVELLFFMLLNAFSSLLVKNAGSYMRRVVLAYVINLIVTIALMLLLLGKKFWDFENIFPAYEALVFCFFSSLILITLIRTVVKFFKDE